MMIDINDEVMKAATLMNRYRVSREDQIEIVRILLACGVEHCLAEQERIRIENNMLVDKAFVN